MTNFNEQGKQYQFVAIAPPPRGYGMLRSDVLALVASVEGEVSSRLKANDNDTVANGAGRLIDRLNAVLYHASGVKKHQLEIEKIAPNKGESAMRNHKELGFDFEALVFQAVASLDSLAVFLESHLSACEVKNAKGKKQQIYFSNLDQALSNSVPLDARASYILKTIVACKTDLENIILSVGRKTLRNQIAHEKPIPELSESHFVIYGLGDGLVLRFDQDVYEMPLIGSGIKLVKILSFILIMAALIMLTIDQSGKKSASLQNRLGLQKDFFIPNWENGFANWRDFIPVCLEAYEPDTFTVFKAERNVFRMDNIQLSKRIYDKSVKVGSRI